MLYTGYALLITLSIVAVRMLWVYGKSSIAYIKALNNPRASTTASQISREAALIGWSGMRGIVSLAAAIALPLTLPNGMPLQGRKEVIFITFVVILITLLIPGLTLPTLLRWLKIQHHSEYRDAKKIRHRLADVAEDKLHHLFTSHRIDETQYDFLKSYFVAQACVHELSHTDEHKHQNIELARLTVFKEQRRQLLEMWKQQEIDDKFLTHLENELDLSEVHIARGELK